MNINMNGKPSKTELASKTCNVVRCADFNIGDIVIYDGYTCMVKKKNKQKCLAIPMPMGWSYFIPIWEAVKRT